MSGWQDVKRRVRHENQAKGRHSCMCGKDQVMQQDTAPWPERAGGASSAPSLRHVSRQKGAAQALALAKQKVASAKAADFPDECSRILEETVQQKVADTPEECKQILEAKVQQEEAAMKRAQPSGQKMDQARARFRRAVDAGEKAMLTLQKAQESFEQAQKHVEPRRRATAGAPGTGDPGVESIDSDLFGPSGPGGRCCIG